MEIKDEKEIIEASGEIKTVEAVNISTTVAPEAKIDPSVEGRVVIPHGAHKAYLIIAGIVFAVLTAVFLLLPRETYSELEKRDLAQFPSLSEHRGNLAGLTGAISQWFSDSEPYRDSFMTLSMSLRDAMRVTIGGDEAVTFRPSAAGPTDSSAESDGGIDSSNPLADNVNNPSANENATIAAAGIIIVGSGEKVRALMAFGGSPGASKPYIDVLGEYARTFPGVHIYSLVAPLATEFYLPEKAAKCSRSQRDFIEHVRQNLPPNVRFVDAYTALSQHVDEDIYLRTDHHWAPLGGFYAARQLARTAGVPFRELDSYDRKVVRKFVGSMYGYSKDIAVKNAPEDFVYYTPRGLNYSTTYVTYRTNSDYQIVSESKPHEGKFFHHFKDGSGSAYLTFMGGDQHLVKVKTGTPGNRKLMIIKDSYGNTLPGYMFYSFAEVHVVDFRYFKNNMVDYVHSNGITDIVVAFNVFNACSSSAARKVKAFLTQRSGNFAAPTPEKSEAQATPKKSESPAPSPAENTLPSETKAEPAAENLTHPEPAKEEPAKEEPVRQQPDKQPDREENLEN